MPEEEEVKRGKWTFAHLPAIPSHFELKPIEKNENRLKVLLKLIKRKDVTALINACDAGREGELIFRNVVQYAKSGKPIRRLWLQSMTAAVDPRRLREAAQRRANAAARGCRRVPVRIRLARRHQRHARDDRVQLEGRRLPADHRRAACRRRRSRSWSSARRRSARSCRATTGRCSAPSARPPASTRAGGSTKSSRRRTTTPIRAPTGSGTRPTRARWRRNARASPAIVTEESKPTTQIAPLLYDLTSLQREANGRFGFSARTTLSLAQALYEKHKALTYPRTDSRALPEDYLPTVRSTLEGLGETNAYGTFAREILKKKWVAAEQADLRQREDLRPLRDHPDARRARST